VTHKTVLQLHLVTESCTICCSHSRQSVQTLLDTPSYYTSCNWNYSRHSTSM